MLFQLRDGQTIEAVLMLYDKRRTLCISSQAGCAMGCTFCATAQGGLARNLTPGEIVAQVLYFARYLADADALPDTDVERPTTVTNIVLMGMGEPMHNYANVWTALRRLTDADALWAGRAQYHVEHGRAGPDDRPDGGRRVADRAGGESARLRTMRCAANWFRSTRAMAWTNCWRRWRATSRRRIAA